VATETFIAGIRPSPGGAQYTPTARASRWHDSSARFKDDIAPLGESLRAKVQGLTPVSFIYKPEYDDGSKQIQYGLIAEEVAEKFPELLVRDADGQPQTVRYHLLTPLLLAEVQRLEREREAQRAQLNEQAGQIAALRDWCSHCNARSPRCRRLPRPPAAWPGPSAETPLAD
jgi:hypothetical protein